MTSTPGLLDGRVALVTGAARGIGRSIALRLAGAGADVAVTSRDVTQLKETVDDVAALARAAEPIALELQDAEAPEAAIAHVYDRFGRLDVVVANSGIGGPTVPLWEVSADEWDETFVVNVRGTFLTVKAAVARMAAAGAPGSVVVIGSMTGKRPLPNRSPYAASKLALVGMVRTLAAEAGPLGIRANLVSPGFVAGDRLDWVIAGQASSRGVSEGEIREEFTGSTPLRRFVAAEDVADAVVYLASDAAAGITGVDLNVTAGLVMY